MSRKHATAEEEDAAASVRRTEEALAARIRELDARSVELDGMRQALDARAQALADTEAVLAGKQSALKAGQLELRQRLEAFVRAEERIVHLELTLTKRLEDIGVARTAAEQAREEAERLRAQLAAAASVLG
jgi:hypothetical protein